jgi:hypothetical protein
MLVSTWRRGLTLSGDEENQFAVIVGESSKGLKGLAASIHEVLMNTTSEK